MKRAFIAICILLAAIAAVLIAFLNSAALQTMAVSPVLRGKFPGSELQPVRAGLGGAEAEGLRLFMPDGAEISLKSAKIKYSLAGLLSKTPTLNPRRSRGWW